jgi:hypothetical protein
LRRGAQAAIRAASSTVRQPHHGGDGIRWRAVARDARELVRPQASPVLLRAIRPKVILEWRILISHVRDRPPVAAVRASASCRRLSTIRKDAATPTLLTGQIPARRERRRRRMVSRRILARCVVAVLEVQPGACAALLGIEDFRVWGLHLFFVLGLDVPSSGSWRSTSTSALCRASYQSYESVQQCRGRHEPHPNLPATTGPGHSEAPREGGRGL